jgi:hypothetical protein
MYGFRPIDSSLSTLVKHPKKGWLPLRARSAYEAIGLIASRLQPSRTFGPGAFEYEGSRSFPRSPWRMSASGRDDVVEDYGASKSTSSGQSDWPRT